MSDRDAKRKLVDLAWDLVEHAKKHDIDEQDVVYVVTMSYRAEYETKKERS